MRTSLSRCLSALGCLLRRPAAVCLLLLLPKPSSRPPRLGYPDRLGTWVANSFRKATPSL